MLVPRGGRPAEPGPGPRGPVLMPVLDPMWGQVRPAPVRWLPWTRQELRPQEKTEGDVSISALFLR